MSHDSEKKVKKYVSTTSTHGVKYVFHGSSKIRRVFWAILFIGSIAGCLQGIISSIIDFSKIPTSTTVYTDHVNVLPFPAVTVCNLNGYNRSYLTEKNLSEVFTAAIQSGGREQSQLMQGCSETPHNQEQSLLNMVQQARQPLTDLIVDCHFLGKPCDMASMFVPYITPVGTCYTFNGENPTRNYLTVSGSGFRHDLQLVVNVRQSEFVGSSYNEAGALMSVHTSDAPAVVWEEGLVVPVGHSAYMSLTHNQIEDRTKRDSSKNLNCLYPKSTPMFEFLQNYNYSYSACREECTAKDIANKCNCFLPIGSGESPPSADYLECTVSDLCCVYNVLQFPTACHCQVLCDHTSYSVTPSYSTLKATSALMEKYNINSTEELETNFLKIRVYFNELSVHREITERSYSLTTLIANFGGSMGIFLGASIISLTELIILIVDIIKDKIRKGWSKISEKGRPQKMKVELISSCELAGSSNYKNFRGSSDDGTVDCDTLDS